MVGVPISRLLTVGSTPHSCQNSSQCFCFRAAQRGITDAKLTFDKISWLGLPGLNNLFYVSKTSLNCSLLQRLPKLLLCYVSSRNFVDSPNRLCVCIWVRAVAGWLVAGLARVWRASPPSLGTSNQFTGTGTWSPALSCTRVALLQGDGG